MRYHCAIIASLALISEQVSMSHTKQDSQPRIAKAMVIGLGGGGLPMFLAAHFNLDIEVVELDPMVVQISRKWFGFEEGPSMRVTVGDGIVAVKQRQKQVQEQGSSQSLDLLIIDAGSLDPSLGLSAPPETFFEDTFLRAARDALKDEGMMVVNCVARSSKRYTQVLNAIQNIFPNLLEINVEEDVNRVLCALRAPLASSKGGSCGTDETLCTAVLGQQIRKAAKRPLKEGIDVESILESLHRINL